MTKEQREDLAHRAAARCQGQDKRTGEQCKRHAGGKDYCWQHRERDAAP